MSFVSKLVHLSVDAILISTTLAGIKKSTGYEVKHKNISKDENISSFIDNYFVFGEKTLDFLVDQMKKYPSYFEKTK
ncbi:hypothetical protein AYI68_g1200 [Smittium mucronatum]|uniref:DUF1748-domain-containing protein n=1 Tax=Smittium mucronatum TaxID=133383 RepID=A0A1R0H685_9FUNG|nr:hypothetical protein AYI68_g1200 [Smittium mucronatum]